MGGYKVAGVGRKMFVKLEKSAVGAVAVLSDVAGSQTAVYGLSSSLRGPADASLT